jgi:hypothetical protein
MIFEFDKDSKAINKRFREYSFKTSNFIINSEILFYTLLIYIVLALIFLILSRITNEDSYIGRGILAIKVKFFFNFLVRLMLEGYLEFFLCTIVNLQQLLFTTTGETISSILSILMFISLILMPGLMHFLLKNYRHKLHYPRFKKQFGEFYDGIKLNSSHAIFFNLYFVLRRLILITSLVYFENITV